LLAHETWTAKGVGLAKKIISSEYEPRKQLSEFLRQNINKQTIVECGSGNRRLADHVINVDLASFEHADVITDITSLPFCSQSIDIIIFDTVLEHVRNPQQCIDEAYRILKPGGEVACITPFIFPYHAYPKHYWNFSEDGLQYLFRNFSNCTVKTNMGPTSALINLFSEYVALACSGRSALFYLIFKGVALIPIFFLKYLDWLWCKSEKAKQIAMCHFTLARK
jgi:SAM-dependent methyltransferase